MMIDYALKFADEPTAIAAAQSLRPQLSRGLWTTASDSGSWSVDHVVPNLKVWRPSQDTTQTVIGRDGGQTQIVVHSYLAGWFAVISAETNAPIQVLLNSSALQFALNRTARMQGLPFVLKNNIGDIITDIACQPLFLMNNPYPVGNYA